MSWANTEKTKQLLLLKAAASELIICLPQVTHLTNELKAAGAEILVYKHLEPTSRFTIVQYGQDGCRVAVGRRKGDDHVIDEFSAEEHPAFHLAQDLVRFARSISANGNLR
jgi:hypothetical protein